MRFLYFAAAAATILILPGTPANASEIRIDGSRVVVTTDSGEIIDTDNLPKGHEIKDGDNVVVDDKGVSIGSITSDGGSQENVRRSTTLKDVVIINKGDRQ